MAKSCDGDRSRQAWRARAGLRLPMVGAADAAEHAGGVAVAAEQIAPEARPAAQRRVRDRVALGATS